MEEITIITRSEWRKWLQENHGRSTGIWMVFCKKHCNKPTLNYEDFVEEALCFGWVDSIINVEEALCFGWVDSIIKKLDKDCYARKVTPRRSNSVWSEQNKKRVAKMEISGLMTDAGRKLIIAAKKSGNWNRHDKPEIQVTIIPEFQNALDHNPKAKSNFEQLTLSHQRRYLLWIQMAKRQETRNRRIREAIDLLDKGQQLGLK